MTTADELAESVIFRRGIPFSLNAIAWSIGATTEETRAALVELITDGRAEHVGDATYRKAPPAPPERT